MINKKQELTVPKAIVIAGVLISFSIFFTTFFFFGGYNNRQKLFLTNAPRPSLPTNYVPPQVKPPVAK